MKYLSLCFCVRFIYAIFIYFFLSSVFVCFTVSVTGHSGIEPALQ